MSKFLWLGRLAQEVIPFVREIVAAVRAGDGQKAADAAQRAAELQAFHALQRSKRARH